MSEGGLDVRVSRRLERVRALSNAVDVDMLRELIENLRGLDARLRDSGSDDNERLMTLSRVGPLSLSTPGAFHAEDASAYEARIELILRAMVEPESQPSRLRPKRSKLHSQVKASFRDERVLAQRDETLDSHRIVSLFPLDEGLVADFVLRNGAMQVIETVDASGNEDTPRKTVADIAVSGLVLERARMKFGEAVTKGRVVYSASAALEKIAGPSLAAVEHQGAEITNWASADDRLRFLHSVSSLATPLPRKRRGKGARFAGPESEKLRLQ